MFGELAERGGVAEVVVPVLTPNLVPGGDQWGVGADGVEFGGKNEEVREDGGDNEIMFLVSEVFVQEVDDAGGEVHGFGDGAAVVIVEICFRGDGAENHPVVGGLGGSVPEVPAVDGYRVAFVGEAGVDLVDAFLGASGNEGGRRRWR